MLVNLSIYRDLRQGSQKSVKIAQSPQGELPDDYQGGDSPSFRRLHVPITHNANGLAMAYRITLPVLALFLSLVASSATSSAAEAVAWRSNLDAAKIEAAQSNRLVLLHFYTKSCGPCRLLDKNVFSQPQIAQDIEKNYVPVKVDAEASPAMRGAFRIERVPTEVIITPQGNQVASMGSPAKPAEYVSRLDQVANHFRQTNQQLVRTSHQTPTKVNNAYANLNVAANEPRTPAAQPQTAAQVTQNPYVTRQTAPAPPQQTASAASPGSRYSTQPTQNSASSCRRWSCKSATGPTKRCYRAADTSTDASQRDASELQTKSLHHEHATQSCCRCHHSSDNIKSKCGDRSNHAKQYAASSFGQ